MAPAKRSRFVGRGGAAERAIFARQGVNERYEASDDERQEKAPALFSARAVTFARSAGSSKGRT